MENVSLKSPWIFLFNKGYKTRLFLNAWTTQLQLCLILCDIALHAAIASFSILGHNYLIK